MSEVHKRRLTKYRLGYIRAIGSGNLLEASVDSSQTCSISGGLRKPNRGKYAIVTRAAGLLHSVAMKNNIPYSADDPQAC